MECQQRCPNAPVGRNPNSDAAARPRQRRRLQQVQAFGEVFGGPKNLRTEPTNGGHRRNLKSQQGPKQRVEEKLFTHHAVENWADPSLRPTFPDPLDPLHEMTTLAPPVSTTTLSRRPADDRGGARGREKGPGARPSANAWARARLTASSRRGRNCPEHLGIRTG